MKNQSGFTLIELTIVILIAGLMMGLFGNFLVNYSTNIKQKKVQSDLDLIAESLQTFLEANGKLPCPARRDITETSADFGREANVICTAASGPGVVTSGGAVIGSVPVRAINIPDEYMLDPWGMRYTYAVTAAQASEGTPYDPSAGVISVIDGNGNSQITPSGNGAYVVLSHGKNGIGAFTKDGIEYVPCNTSGSANEQENCNGTSTFLNTLLTSDNAATYFDDYTIYQSGLFLAPKIPSGAVMAFDLAACPPGWEDFNDAAGRSIVGVGTRSDIAAPGNVPDTSSSTSVDYNLRDTGGTKHLLNPNSFTMADYNTYEGRTPYIALRYCRRI